MDVFLAAQLGWALQFLLFLHVLLICTSTATATAAAKINRKDVVSRFNPTRHASSNITPMQVGNGNFAFGADITGLQTFLPFATLSSWGWHNDSLPTTPGQTSPADFTGLDWWTHGRLVNYDQPNPAEADISQWLIANPHRINLGRIGLHFGGQNNVTESDLTDKSQTLDLYSGTITSRFRINGTAVTVWTWVDPLSDTVAVKIASELLSRGQLGVFFDYPYATGQNKFEAPFVGDWNNVSRHETQLSALPKGGAQIKHVLDNTTYYTAIHWSGEASITPVNGTHRYILQPGSSPPSQQTFELTATFSPSSNPPSPSGVDSVAQNCVHWWQDYWETGAFVDLTATGNATAIEIQRRTILSQYLLAVNEAGHDPPQESGLVNNGWYGKFHMEMYLWHSAHWIPWGKLPLLERSIGVYNRFLPSSIQRAQDQGYAGARWGKMSDPTGRSAPGEINSLLIWQQPHVFYFAETEYAAAANSGGQQQQKTILQKWDPILTPSADFMASFAFWNQSTGVYDLGPPMYPASENTPPNSTTNPTFELAYWRFGLDIAMAWKERLGQPVPQSWKQVAEHLAPLPTVAVTDTNTNTTSTTYTLYEGIPNMWLDPETVTSHPALSAIYGLLPPTAMVNETIVAATAAEIARAWNFSQCWGWDFPMLAMNAVRLGEIDRAVGYLVDENFAFDDVGMPVGSADTAPTPYFPGAGALLLAVAMMAGGWNGSSSNSSGGDSSVGLGAGAGTAPGFPRNWDVRAEGFMVML
ncbi:hypothetical protein VTN96DRAFT_3192 [Rasamsonia emersonii]|uniref:Uncharacterized protein n=1 Tax=Rasamsonia emersonii (strain ATCC 16479 / CBS 393.64 / IMI 116815) TaxID=1408163 RepID=A0A0F4Z3K7_RASE3|nr:hypothetical protein T310_1311 [Rasamsonia emersonii CBS 393.64]KKA24646.1 hypothetical protein T310_1311 [Rasamsonia emersonii CBS 393.64]